jgi:hypothetical protein
MMETGTFEMDECLAAFVEVSIGGKSFKKVASFMVEIHSPVWEEYTIVKLWGTRPT